MREEEVRIDLPGDTLRLGKCFSVVGRHHHDKLDEAASQAILTFPLQHRVDIPLQRPF